MAQGEEEISLAWEGDAEGLQSQEAEQVARTDGATSGKKFQVEWKERLKKAIDDVENGMSIRKLAKLNSIAAATINKHIKADEDIVPSGGHPWLSDEIEKKLLHWCLHMAKIGFPLSKQVLPKPFNTF